MKMGRNHNNCFCPIRKCYVVLTLMMLITLTMSCPVSAASKKTKALQAYSAFLQSKGSDVSFSLIYLNNDSVPELCIKRGLGSTVYTFYKGSVRIMDDSNINMFVLTSYYKKKGVLVRMFAHGNISGLYQEYLYCKMTSKTKIRQKLSKSVSASSGKKTYEYRKVTIKGTFDYTKERFNSTTWKTSVLSKTKFDQELKKMVGSRKPTSVKTYENTAENRQKVLR